MMDGREQVVVSATCTAHTFLDALLHQWTLQSPEHILTSTIQQVEVST